MLLRCAAKFLTGILSGFSLRARALAPNLALGLRLRHPEVNSLKIFQRLFLLALWVMAALTLSRAFLVTRYADRVLATDGLPIIIGQGLRFDAVLLGMVFALPVVLLPWLHRAEATRRLAAWLLPAWFALMVPLLFFVEAASAPFIDQFDVRPNWLFVEYLHYPREVLATVSGMHLGLLLGLTVLSLGLAWALFRWLRRDPSHERPVTLRFCVLPRRSCCSSSPP